ncbi:hypothetical protein [Nannocystis sp. SCPEA4]|uniref:hypothetical protein n=1 Tax=Nannocystis sp. SCPEA4 TaxID=2996787 RepID=UPI00226E949D|nr:hypothetical protein [Nannocystis sp. SCPEA4]
MTPPNMKTRREATVGQRIAGALMVLWGIAFVAGKIVLPLEPGEHWYTGFIGCGVDFVLGAWLLRGGRGAVNWAIAKALLSLCVYPFAPQVNDELWLVVILMVSEVGLLLLLLGRAGVLRIVAGLLAAAPYLALTGLTLYAEATGRPVATLAQLFGDLEAAPPELLGIAGEYVLRVPDSGWYLSPREAAAPGEMQVDHALYQPDAEAELVIFVDRRDDAPASPDELADLALANDLADTDHHELVSREPLPRYPYVGRLLHTRDTRGDAHSETLIAVIASGQYEYRLVAFAPQARFPAVEAELRDMIDGFTLLLSKEP